MGGEGEGFLNFIRTSTEKPIINITLNGEGPNAFSYKIRNKQIQRFILHSSLLFNRVLDVLARVIKQEKGN